MLAIPLDLIFTYPLCSAHFPRLHSALQQGVLQSNLRNSRGSIAMPTKNHIFPRNRLQVAPLDHVD